MSDPMTPAELAELRRLHEAATIAPWERCRLGPKGEIPGIIHSDIDEDWSNVAYFDDGSGDAMTDNHDADAAFIVAARNALPRLLAEIERLRAELAKRPKLWAVRNRRGSYISGLGGRHHGVLVWTDEHKHEADEWGGNGLAVVEYTGGENE